MIELLRIRNLALIEDLELEFSPGFNVLTGETGAGKSFILKAIGFLTGEQMPGDYVRPGAERAVVEGVFSLPGQEFVIRRELSSDSGRSRVYVNGDLAARETVLALRPKLIALASQQAQLRLRSPAFQARLLDAFVDDPGLAAAKDETLTRLSGIRTRLAAIEERRRDLLLRRDFLEHQRAAIAKVDPRPGEEEELLARRAELKGLEDSRRAVDEALEVLSGERGGLTEAVGRLERALGVLAAGLPEFAAARDEAVQFKLGLSELTRSLYKISSREGACAEVEAVEARLFALASLSRQLKRSLPEIESLYREIEENLAFCDASGLDVRDLAREEDEAARLLGGQLATLGAARERAAKAAAAAIEGELAGLGFGEAVRVVFEISPKTVYVSLAGQEYAEDKAALLFQPNPGQPPLPLDKIASGGELSRFYLAVTGVLAADPDCALVFDEIDSGIGGLTLAKVAARLKDLAASRQVLAITHWPLIAKGAARHFLVEKTVRDKVTFTSCRALGPGETPLELARMSGGGTPGAT